MNTDNQKQPQPNKLEQAQTLLSPYLDGEVSEAERQLVEQQLAISAELRQEYEALQRVVNLLSALPQESAPRPLTLSETDVGTVSPRQGLLGLPWWIFHWATLMATALIVVVVGGLWLTGQFEPPDQLALIQEESQPPAQEAMPAEAPLAAEVPSEADTANETTETEPELAADTADEAVTTLAMEESTPAERLSTGEAAPPALREAAPSPTAPQSAEAMMSTMGDAPREAQPAPETEEATPEITATATPQPTHTASPTPTTPATPVPAVPVTQDSSWELLITVLAFVGLMGLGLYLLRRMR